jgi:hypothetical protein
MKAGMNFFGAPVTATVPVTVPMPHCPEEPELAEALELLPQHMLELPLDPELLPTHDSEPTIRLAKELKPKPDAICGRTVTSKTKLAAAITAIRARGFQVVMLFILSMPHPSSISVGRIWANHTPVGGHTLRPCGGPVRTRPDRALRA